jgi:hypothetical protein
MMGRELKSHSYLLCSFLATIDLTFAQSKDEQEQASHDDLRLLTFMAASSFKLQTKKFRLLHLELSCRCMHFYETRRWPFVVCTHNTSNVTHTFYQVQAQILQKFLQICHNCLRHVVRVLKIFFYFHVFLTAKFGEMFLWVIANWPTSQNWGEKKVFQKKNITEEGGFYKIRVYETPENPTSETLTLGEY